MSAAPLLPLLLLTAQHLLEPASTTRSSFQNSLACSTPQSTKTANFDPTDDREGIQTYTVEFIVYRKPTFSILPIRRHHYWHKYLIYMRGLGYHITDEKNDFPQDFAGLLSLELLQEDGVPEKKCGWENSLRRQVIGPERG